MSDKRVSNIEVLRIAAMFCIVGTHCAHYATQEVWGGSSISAFGTMVLGVWGQLGVALFIIITSYFATEKEVFHSISMIKISLKTWLYSAVITAVIAGIFGYRHLNAEQLLKEFTSPLSGQYWYISTYLLFYLILPFLYRFQKMCLKEDLSKLCLVWVPISLLLGFFTVSIPGGSLFNFVVVYLIVALMKQGGFVWFRKHKLLADGYIVLFLGGLCVISSLKDFIGYKAMYAIVDHTTRLNIFTVLFALILFQKAKDGRQFSNRFVNKLASSTLACYIISENMVFQKTESDCSLLWVEWLHCDLYYSSNWYVLYFIAIVLVVMMVCIIIDWLLNPLLKKIIGKASGLCKRFDDWYLAVGKKG